MVKLTVILATLALVLTLAACGGDPTATPTLEPTPTPTATSSPIPTATATATPTPTSTPTATPTATARPVPTPTATATPTLTPTPTRTPRPTATPTPTRTPTPTPVPTPTTQPTVTPTPTRIGADDPENFPPFPNIYSGGVLVGGQSAPNGTPIFARIGNYQTPSVGVIDGRYSQLTAGPGSIFFYGLTITFHTIVNEVELQAAETAIFREVKFDVVPPRNFFNTVDLTFPSP